MKGSQAVGVRLVVRALLVMRPWRFHAECSARSEGGRRSRRCAFEDCRRTVGLLVVPSGLQGVGGWRVGSGLVR